MSTVCSPAGHPNNVAEAILGIGRRCRVASSVRRIVHSPSMRQACDAEIKWIRLWVRYWTASIGQTARCCCLAFSDDDVVEAAVPAKRLPSWLSDVANVIGADVASHMCTGAGSDQRRLFGAAWWPSFADACCTGSCGMAFVHLDGAWRRCDLRSRTLERIRMVRSLRIHVLLMHGHPAEYSALTSPSADDARCRTAGRRWSGGWRGSSRRGTSRAGISRRRFRACGRRSSRSGWRSCPPGRPRRDGSPA